MNRIAGYLSTHGVPENGCFIFASADDIRIVEPPVKLCQDSYRWGKSFDYEKLNELMGPQERVGLLSINMKGATVSVKEGDFVRIIQRFSSGIPGQHNQGGQSQQRFLRAHGEAVKAYVRRVKAYMNGVNVNRWKLTGNKFLVAELDSFGGND